MFIVLCSRYEKRNKRAMSERMLNSRSRLLCIHHGRIIHSEVQNVEFVVVTLICDVWKGEWRCNVGKWCLVIHAGISHIKFLTGVLYNIRPKLKLKKKKTDIDRWFPLGMKCLITAGNISNPLFYSRHHQMCIKKRALTTCTCWSGKYCTNHAEEIIIHATCSV